MQHAISDARAALAAVRKALESADDASTLAQDVVAALSSAVAAERTFAEAKQRKDALDREGAAAGRDLAALEARLAEVGNQCILCIREPCCILSPPVLLREA